VSRVKQKVSRVKRQIHGPIVGGSAVGPEMRPRLQNRNQHLTSLSQGQPCG
jgi:hypothetical protein